MKKVIKYQLTDHKSHLAMDLEQWIDFDVHKTHSSMNRYILLEHFSFHSSFSVSLLCPHPTVFWTNCCNILSGFDQLIIIEEIEKNNINYYNYNSITRIFILRQFNSSDSSRQFGFLSHWNRWCIQCNDEWQGKYPFGHLAW